MEIRDFNNRMDFFDYKAIIIYQDGSLSPEAFAHCNKMRDKIVKLSTDAEQSSGKSRIYLTSLYEMEVNAYDDYIKDNHTVPAHSLPVLPTIKYCAMHKDKIKTVYKNGTGDMESYTRFTIVRHPFGKVSDLSDDLISNAEYFIVTESGESRNRTYRGAGRNFENGAHIRWGYNHALVTVMGGLDI